MGLTPEQRADLRFALYMNADEADYAQTLAQFSALPTDEAYELLTEAGREPLLSEALKSTLLLPLQNAILAKLLTMRPEQHFAVLAAPASFDSQTTHPTFFSATNYDSINGLLKSLEAVQITDDRKYAFVIAKDQTDLEAENKRSAPYSVIVGRDHLDSIRILGRLIGFLLGLDLSLAEKRKFMLDLNIWNRFNYSVLMLAASYPNDLGLEVVKQMLAALTCLGLNPDEIYDGLNRKNAQGSSAVKLAFANNSVQTAKAILDVVAYLPISKAKKLAFSVEPSGAPIWDSPTADKILRPYRELASRPDAETIFAAYVAHCPQEFLATAIRAYFTDKVVSPFVLNKFDDFYNFANQYIQKTKAKGLFKRNRPLSEAETRALKEQIDTLFARFKSETAQIVAQLKVIANVNPLICEEFIERLSLHFKNHSPIMPREYWTAVGRELLERFQENTLHPTGEALGERLDKIYQAIDAYYQLLDAADAEAATVWAFMANFILILSEDIRPTVAATRDQTAAEEASFAALALTETPLPVAPQSELAAQNAQQEAGPAASTDVAAAPPSIGFSSVDAWYTKNTQSYGVGLPSKTIRASFIDSGELVGKPSASSSRTTSNSPSAASGTQASSSRTADRDIDLFEEGFADDASTKKQKIHSDPLFAYESTTAKAKTLRSRRVSDIDAPETSSATFSTEERGSRVQRLGRKISAAFRHK